MIESYLDKDAVTLVQEPVKDKWGTPTGSGTQIVVDARVEYETVMVTDFDGNEEVSRVQVVISPRTVTHEDKVLLDGTEYGIIRWQKLKDFDDQAMRIYLR